MQMQTQACLNVCVALAAVISSRPTLIPSARKRERRQRCCTYTPHDGVQHNRPHPLHLNPQPVPPSLDTASEAIAVSFAAKDVEHPVGRRREAHMVARGGGGARRRQRSPGVGRRAESVQVVVVSVCGERRGKRSGAATAGGGRHGMNADKASRRAWLGVSEWALLYAQGRPLQSGVAAGRGQRLRHSDGSQGSGGRGCLGAGSVVYKMRRAVRTRGVLLAVHAIRRLAAVRPAGDAVLLPFALSLHLSWMGR
jgi:hypothetical protein